MDFKEVNSRCQIETPLNPAKKPDMTIAVHSGFIGFILRLFGKAFSIKDASGNKIYLNRNSAIKWLKNHDLDEQTIKTKGVYRCILELTLVPMHPSPKADIQPKVVSNEPKETTAVADVSKNIEKSNSFIFEFEFLKEGDLIKQLPKTNNLNFEITQRSTLAQKQAEPKNNKGIICRVVKPTARLSDNLYTGFQNLIDSYGKNRVVLIIARSKSENQFNRESIIAAAPAALKDVLRKCLVVWEFSLDIRDNENPTKFVSAEKALLDLQQAVESI